MNKGVILFAHNSKTLDYALMSIIAGGLAKKNLGVPVSLITDQYTVEWLKTSKMIFKAETVFDKIITADSIESRNVRVLHDGNYSTFVPFINSSRSMAWDLTPYDTTLIIDSDFLILSDSLNQYWDVDENIMISKGMFDILGNRIGELDKRVSHVGVKMFWATTVMFKKNEQSKIFFDLVKNIQQHYEFYGDIFGFDPRQYRNDIAFSVAKHILDGFQESSSNSLPMVLTALDKDMLHDINENNCFKFLLNESGNFITASVKNTDIHIMNKQSIVRNKEKLLRLI